jgi:hypothetical protein
VVAIELNEPSSINIPETLFMIYGLGFTLEKLATMQEHGITGTMFALTSSSKFTHATAVYFKGTWVSQITTRRDLL